MITVEDVCVDYPGRDGRKRRAVAGVTLRIEEAQFVCVVGPSGSGKTSLLNLVAGFTAPTSGRVLFDGEPVVGPGPDRGVVFQEPTLFPWLTVEQNVGFGLRYGKNSQVEADRRVADAIRLVGLEGHEREHPHALSGGMRQRAAIARVLVLDPRALLMDEPFSALDANARERLQDALLEAWEQHRRTIVYVTHSVEEAAYLADRVLVLGTPPDSVKYDVAVDIPRPRNRASDAVRVMTMNLRAMLDELPCCVVGG